MELVRSSLCIAANSSQPTRQRHTARASCIMRHLGWPAIGGCTCPSLNFIRGAACFLGCGLVPGAAQGYERLCPMRPSASCCAWMQENFTTEHEHPDGGMRDYDLRKATGMDVLKRRPLPEERAINYATSYRTADALK